VTEQWVTTQCELYLLLSLIFFATVMDFGCALLSFTAGMHGGYCSRIIEADRV
jgi:hypothetical protein